MKIFFTCACLLFFYSAAVNAEPPGSTTMGDQYRQNGRIVSQPKVYNPSPYYYQGNLIYQSQGSPYRDRSGKIQYRSNYTEYPYRRPVVNYEKERQRIADTEKAREAKQQSQQQQQPTESTQIIRQSNKKVFQDRQKAFEDSLR